MGTQCSRALRVRAFSFLAAGLLAMSWVAPTAAFTLVVDKAIAWGDPASGAINVPVAATDQIAQVSAGLSFSVARRLDGHVIAWGQNDKGQATVPAAATAISSISAGGAHVLALKSTGLIVAWGDNASHQLDVPLLPAGYKYTAIAAGRNYSLAIRQGALGNDLVAWGDNGFGQLDPPVHHGILSISAADYHGLAVKSDHTVMAWGYNSAGQANVPAGLTNVVAVAGGFAHSVALKSDGTVVAWGANTLGQLNVPPGLNHVIAISAGAFFTLALKSDGTIVAWGSNTTGQTTVPAGTSHVTAIDAGTSHALAIVDMRAPQAPTGVAATPGNGTAAVSWSAPADNGGSPIVGYTATSSPGGKTCQTLGALSCTVPGLTNGTPYTFTVTAKNDLGTSSPSMASTAVTPLAPAAPTPAVTATPASEVAASPETTATAEATAKATAGASAESPSPGTASPSAESPSPGTAGGGGGGGFDPLVAVGLLVGLAVLAGLVAGASFLFRRRVAARGQGGESGGPAEPKAPTKSRPKS
ncbi:MAG: fibronectin type III domain-containing protein [Candidatus Limnocylindrales bacterium]